MQGPPGTGKSQTITNLIATAVEGGQEGPLRRRETGRPRSGEEPARIGSGIGAVGLELHSNKANKRMVLEEIGEDPGSRPSESPGAGAVVHRLTAAREALNAHTAAMNARSNPQGSRRSSFSARWSSSRRGASRLRHSCFLTPKSGVSRRSKIARDGSKTSCVMPGIWARPHSTRGVVSAERCRSCPVSSTDCVARSKNPAKLDEAEKAYRELSEHMAVRIPDAPTLQMLQTFISSASGSRHPGRGRPQGNGWRHLGSRPAGIRDHQSRKAWAVNMLKSMRKVAPSGWDADVGRSTKHRGHGRSWLRWLSSDYRKAVAEFRGLLSVPCRKIIAERWSYWTP